MPEERMSETDQVVNQEAGQEHWQSDEQSHPKDVKGHMCQERPHLRVFEAVIPEGNLI